MLKIKVIFCAQLKCTYYETVHLLYMAMEKEIASLSCVLITFLIIIVSGIAYVCYKEHSYGMIVSY